MKLRTAIGMAVGTLVSIMLLGGLSSRLAYAAPTTCTGILTGAHDSVVVPKGADCTLLSAQVAGNVRVEQDASLLATGFPVSTTIGGNVHGIHSRSVFMQFATQVGGNFHVHGGDAGTTSGFDVNCKVGGNALIELNAGKTFVDAAIVGRQLHVNRNTGPIEVEFNTVGGQIRIEDNILEAACTPGFTPPPSFGLVVCGMSAAGNTVGGNMQVLRNSGDGTKAVQGNNVARRLVCRDNDDPFVGTPNVAASAEGQCAP
jgi:hypothetical protein